LSIDGSGTNERKAAQGRGAAARRVGRWRRGAAFQDPLLESALPVIKLLFLVLSGAKLGKLFASGGTMAYGIPSLISPGES
jgi:hypothetical protein